MLCFVSIFIAVIMCSIQSKHLRLFLIIKPIKQTCRKEGIFSLVLSNINCIYSFTIFLIWIHSSNTIEIMLFCRLCYCTFKILYVNLLYLLLQYYLTLGSILSGAWESFLLVHRISSQIRDQIMQVCTPVHWTIYLTFIINILLTM